MLVIFKEREVFAPVLQTFVHALPRTFREIHAQDGTLIQLLITGEAGGDWFLQREQGAWTFSASGVAPNAGVVFDQETAWRLFTRGISKDEALQQATLTADNMLAIKVFDTVSIIA